ncbi:SLBB domain-containing protein [bacterium]|nr:SLBB domain-containing protein [bacterium]
MRKATRLTAAILLCLVLQSAGSVEVHAQKASNSPASLLEQAGSNPLMLLRQRLSQGGMAASAIPLEGAVDPDTYVVGPGDSFSISISGQDATGTPVVVAVDGRIILPEAGAVMVGGLTLSMARNSMLRALSTSYSNADLEVSLVQSRQFYVHVAGAVSRPGRYLALPVARVSSVLEFAFADTSSSAISQTVFRPSLRNIELIHKDGSKQAVDLIRYFASGDLESNPFLTDGDIISVPSSDPDFASISVGGYIPYPGPFEFKPGDTLFDLIALSGGLPDNKNVSGVRVHRITDGKIETFSFTPADAIGDQGQQFKLRALDVISVSQPDEQHGLVHIEGHVQFPGSYPIVSGLTTLQDVVEAAGGPKSDALLRGAYIERRSLPKLSQGSGAGRYQGQDLLKQALSADSSAFLQQLRLTDMSFLSRSYFALESRLQHRVSVNLSDALSTEGKPVLLEANDRIVIPKDVRSVYVVGQVKQPGYVAVEAGMTIDYYIAAAGGLSDFADRVFVVNPANGTYFDAPGGEVFSGDVIFVDRSEAFALDSGQERLILERQNQAIEEQRIRSDARFRTIQTILQGVGTVASTVILIISLRR